MDTPPRSAPLRLALPLTLAVLSSACLENEEEIEVRADGSIEVVVGAEGGAEDFTDGYPVPLHGPWVAEDDVTRAWLAAVGPATGGTGIDPVAAEGDWRPGGASGDVRLASRAVFASVDDWPERLTPDSEPYASAYQRRSASLEVIRGERTVYVFERVFHRRPLPRASFFEQLKLAFDTPSLRAAAARYEENDDLSAVTDSDWNKASVAARAAYREHAALFVRHALEGLFLGGDGELAPEAVGELVERVSERAPDALGAATLRRAVEEYLALEAEEKSGNEDVDVGAPLVELDAELRDQLRTSLLAELERHGLSERARNGVLARLEWAFTATDHESDLGDEDFHVGVRMPGVIVSGNYDELEDGRAVWEFAAPTLVDGDVRLRVVSVL